MTTHDIPGRLAEAATSKLLWAHAHVNTPESDRYMRLAADAENAVIGTPAANNNQIIAKLALALDWASEWSTPSFRALIQSAIADLEWHSPIESPEPPPVNPRPAAQPRAYGPRPASAKPLLAPPTPSILKVKAARRERAPAAKLAAQSAGAAAPALEAVWVTLDRRSRPCVIAGTLYQSIAEACRKTGMSCSQVKQVSQPV